jgi:hypothetical protein
MFHRQTGEDRTHLDVLCALGCARCCRQTALYMKETELHCFETKINSNYCCHEVWCVQVVTFVLSAAGFLIFVLWHVETRCLMRTTDPCISKH